MKKLVMMAMAAVMSLGLAGMAKHLIVLLK